MTNIKNILTIALPAMVENLLQMLMGVVDNYLVAQVGLIAVSGVSVANNIITIYQAIFIALGTAISSLIAKSRGEQHNGKVLHYQSEGLFATLLLSFVLGLISVFLGQPILKVLGTEVAVTQTGGEYLLVVGGLSVSLGLMTTLGAFLRAQGQPKWPMYISFLTNLINAVLSALAIFVWHWGIIGVASATVISRIIGLVLLACQLPMRAIIKNMHPKIDSVLLQIALPAAAERLMMRVGDVVIIAIVASFGTEVVAGNAIGETLTQFNYMPGLGIATATVILVAQYLGTGDKQVIKRLVRDSYLTSLFLMLMIGVAIYFSGGLLTTLFTRDEMATQASLTVLFYSFVGAPATAGTLIYTAVWQGLGNAKRPFYATTFGMWVVRILCGCLLGVALGLGLSGVWLATLLDNLFRWCYLSWSLRKWDKREVFK